MATRLAPDSVYNALVALVEDPACYRSVTLAGRAAFAADFTLARQAEAVRRILGLATAGVESGRITAQQ